MSCKRRNQRSTRCGDCRRTIQLVAIVTVMATAMPTNGATKMKITGLVQPETMMARNPARAIAAPPYAPISAWDELVGSPRDSVSRFQRMAPNRPASTTCSLIKLMRTKPWPIVFATAVPNTNAAMKFQNAAQTTAHNGVRTRVETTVAMEFAASCQPLENSNARASPTINRRRLKLSKAANLAINEDFRSGSPLVAASIAFGVAIGGGVRQGANADAVESGPDDAAKGGHGVPRYAGGTNRRYWRAARVFG